MTSIPRLRTLVAALFAGTSASQASVLVDFSDNAAYDNNFAEKASGAFVSRNSGGYLVRTDTGAGTATSTIFNTHATGGSAGSGGTTINSPYDTFGGTSGMTIQVDYYQANPQPGPAGTSFGFYVKAPQSTTPTTGYAAIFRLTDSGADFRVWDSDSNPNIAGVGTQLGTTQFYNVGFAASTFYTLKLEVIDIGSTVKFTGSIWNQGGAVIKTFTAIT
ncbi:MAG: hypothetical protein RLZZ214_614, partial [Verrucomicrobiota bacterium]